MRRFIIALAALAVSPLALANPNTVPVANLTLTAGGTAQALVAVGQCNGILWINNAFDTTGEGGIAAVEGISVSLIGTAAGGGAGPALQVAPGVIQPFLPQGNAVTWVAATTGHKINAFCQ